MDIGKINHHLDVIKKCISIIEDELQSSRRNVVVRVGDNLSSNVNLKVNGAQVLKAQDNRKPSVQTLDVAKRLMKEKGWPEAVPSDLLADNTLPEDLSARAVGILEATVDRNLEGLRFLDFGCGDGYTIPAAIEKGASLAIGYDIKRCSWWNKIGSEKGIFVDNIEDLKTQEFDIIFIYDVLDHVDKPQDVLHKVNSLLAPNGIVYVRCHPWTSRHGGHLYKDLNRAYIHVAIDEVNLKELGYNPEPIKKILRPLKYYKSLIQESGFKILRDYVHLDSMENFFRNNELVKQALHRHWDQERKNIPVLDDGKINHILEIEFVDFVIQANATY